MNIPCAFNSKQLMVHVLKEAKEKTNKQMRGQRTTLQRMEDSQRVILGTEVVYLYACAFVCILPCCILLQTIEVQFIGEDHRIFKVLGINDYTKLRDVLIIFQMV